MGGKCAVRIAANDLACPFWRAAEIFRGRSGGKGWGARLALRTSKPATSGRALQIDGCKKSTNRRPCDGTRGGLYWDGSLRRNRWISWYVVVPR